MTRATSSGARSSIAKIAVAGVLIAIPTATASVPAYAAPGFGGTPNTPAVLPAPLPSDPPTDAPQPPPPPAQSTTGYTDDWWGYGTDGDNDYWCSWCGSQGGGAPAAGGGG